MEKLEKIKWDLAETAFVFNTPGYDYDRIFSTLTLDDYDWMQYKLEAWLPTKEQGLLHVEFQYFGAAECVMYARKMDGGAVRLDHEYHFPCDVFKQHITAYMKKHILQWDRNCVFYGGELVVRFFNDVLQTATSHAICDPDAAQ